ncbi:hypothetical protein LCGC14_1737970 [marine sediment metagenome]|uniref:Uncharacterized protein n=1 Tax=marine sediment metagenome TaxID=412755 RepID=A0A0F9K785_9ZZZZ
MEYSWQFDPLEPDKPVELTCAGIVIATTTLNNAQELATKLNAYEDTYEALKDILTRLPEFRRNGEKVMIFRLNG